MSTWREDCHRSFPVYFLVRGAPYELFGFLKETDLHLFGVDTGGIFLIVKNNTYGRVILTFRFLYGGQLSLFTGLVTGPVAHSTPDVSAFSQDITADGVTPPVVERRSLVSGVPWLYFLIAVRAFLPLSLGAKDAFLLLIALIGLVGWAQPSQQPDTR